jgi:hypothetical protein
MSRTRRTLDTLTPALKAIGELFEDGFGKLNSWGKTEALMAHSEIERMPVAQKTNPFFRHFFPLRKQMVALLADSYRRCFKLALAHVSQTGGDPDKWAQGQLWPAVCVVLDWIRDWYILACDGENQSMRRLGSMPFVPGQTVSLSIPTTLPPFPPPTSWRAPAWLFGVSIALFGIGFLKEQHVPARDSEEKLGEAHTRLLLKGARKVFLWELGAAIETVRNEEIAAAGAVPAEMAGGQGGQTNKPEHWLKGAEGLVRKADLSQYMHNLTEKQQLAFSLKFEYELGLAEVASRMGLDRKTAYEHIEAAKRKIDQARSNEKSKAHRPKSDGE